MRILFTTVALPGHFFPLVPLAWACRSLGHDVLVATTGDFILPVVRSGLPVASCGPAIQFADLVRGEAAELSLEERRHVHGRAFGRIATHSLAGTEDLVSSWRPDLIVSERAEFAGPVAAAHHGVAQVELRWGVAALDEYRSGGAIEFGHALPEPALILNPWPPSLRLAHTAGQQSMRYVPYNGDAHLTDWILTRRRDKPRICVTFGTLLPRLGNAEIILPVLENLARLGADIVVAVEEDVVATWPPLPEAVRYAGRMPLAQVLDVCDVSIHHGGQGTALTALGAGLPQLVLPQFDDQLDNAEAVVKSGAGLSLSADEINAQTVAGCCHELLGAEQFGQAAVSVAVEMAAQPGLAEISGMLADLVA